MLESDLLRHDLVCLVDIPRSIGLPKKVLTFRVDEVRLDT